MIGVQVYDGDGFNRDADERRRRREAEQERRRAERVAKGVREGKLCSTCGRTKRSRLASVCSNPFHLNIKKSTTISNEADLVAKFDKVSLPILRAGTPWQSVNDIVGVQPIAPRALPIRWDKP